MICSSRSTYAEKRQQQGRTDITDLSASNGIVQDSSQSRLHVQLLCSVTTSPIMNASSHHYTSAKSDSGLVGSLIQESIELLLLFVITTAILTKYHCY